MRRRILLTLAIVVGAILLVGAGLAHWFLRGDGVRAALERQATSWLGYPVRIGEADLRILPRPTLELGTVLIGDPAAITLARVRVSTGLRALLSRRVEDAEIVVADSVIDMPLPFAVLGAAAKPPSGPPRPTAPLASGSSGAEPSATASEDATGGGASLTIASVRTIRLENVRVRSRGREIAVSARAALTGDTLDLQAFDARSGDTVLEATGRIVLAPRMDAALAIQADRLAVDELMALAAAFTPASAAASGAPAAADDAPRVRAELRAGVVDVSGGVEVTNVNATLTSAAGRLTVEPLTFNLFGGGFAGEVEADLRQPQAIGLTLEGALSDLDGAALAAFGGAPGAITGRLSSRGTFTGRGADVAAALDALRGTGSAQIVDGTLPGLDLVRTIVLFFGRPAADAPASAGARFNRIEATVSLANRVLALNPLALRSQDADVEGQATLSLATKALEGRARLLLSEALSAQAGTDLARFTREGGRVILPATIGGTLNQPRVSIDAAETIQRGLKNELQRRLDRFLNRP